MSVLPVINIVLILALIFAGVAFYRRQKSGAMGGVASPQKVVWLGFCIYFWFFFPLLALSFSVKSAGLQLIFAGMALLMWTRGIAEIFMLYVTKNWRPPYGISHDILCLLFLTYVVVTRASVFSAMDWSVWSLYTCTLIAEVYYAAAFYLAVKGQTTGDEGIWYADETNPVFGTINRVTLTLDIVFLLWTSVVLYQLGFFPLGL